MPWPETQEDNLVPETTASQDPSQTMGTSSHMEGPLQQGATAGSQDHQSNGSAASETSEGKQNVKTSSSSTPGSQNGPLDSASHDDNRPSSPSTQTNGNGLSRKRSRSGSIIPATSPSSGEEVVQQRETPLEKLLLEQYLHREWQHSALAATRNSHQETLQRKLAERDYYFSLQQERQLNPAAIFGAGYEGFGNARTDLKSQHPQLLYPSNRRRPGGRKAKDLRIPRDDMLTQSDQAEHLVPIRIDIDWDKVKLRDTFTWNLHDRVTMPDVFAEKLIEDLGLPLESCGPLVRQVTQSIQDQIANFYPHVFIEDEPLDPHLPYSAYKNDELRVLIKLNITIGQHTLVDQFEWEINDPHNSPEDFAVQMARDLSLTGEFTTAIAHSIREQIQLFSKSLYILSYPFDGRPIEDPDLKTAFQPSPILSSFRPFQAAKDYTPYLYELNEAELERTEVSISREQRRQKRSVNRRGGPALPDLKDRQRTIRTMVVSSVIPGAAASIDESRLFKRSGTSRRGRAAAGQRDGLDDSDSSGSEESSVGSPAMSHLAQGTARTRGMRQASSIAQNAIRGQILGRSATPETSLHGHETRTSSRRRDYREESSEAPDTLVVKLRINPQRLHQFVKDLKSRSRQYTASPGGLATTPKSNARSSMGPPQTQAQQVPPIKRPSAFQLNGVIDAPHPPQPGIPGVSPYTDYRYTSL